VRWACLSANSADSVRFASAILLRPFQVKKREEKKDEKPELSQYEQQVELKRRLKTMLENEQLIPRVSSFRTRRLRHARVGPLILLPTGVNFPHSLSEDDAGEQPTSGLALFQSQPHCKGKLPSFSPR
jgi:hypothetical protein